MQDLVMGWHLITKKGGFKSLKDKSFLVLVLDPGEASRVRIRGSRPLRFALALTERITKGGRWGVVRGRLSNWCIQRWMGLYLLQGVQRLLQASNVHPSRNLVVLVESHNLHLLQPLRQRLDALRYPESTNASSSYCRMHAHIGLLVCHAGVPSGLKTKI